MDLTGSAGGAEEGVVVGELTLFGVELLLISLMCSLAFGATAGYALASFGRYPRALGIAVGGLLPFPGLLVLALVSMFRGISRAKRASRLAKATREVPQRGVHLLHVEVSLPETGGLSPGGLRFDMTAPHAGVQRLAPEEPRGASGSRGGLMPAPPKRAVPGRGAWLKTRLGLWAIVPAALALAMVAGTLFTEWFRVDSVVSPPYNLYAWGTGLDVLVEASLVLMGVGLAVLLLRPYRWAAVLIAFVTDGWLFFALVAVTVRDAVVRLLGHIGALSVTVGDTLRTLGIEAPDSSVQALAGTGPLTDLAAHPSTLTAADVGNAIPNVSLGLGVAIFLFIGGGVAANIGVISTLKAAHAASVRRDGVVKG
jgi:hypothetical protein